MSIIKYSEEVLNKAVELRKLGKSIPEITEETKVPAYKLKLVFSERGIKLTEVHKEKAMARRWLNHEPTVDGTKICSKCKKYKTLEEFHENKKRLSGVTASCIECSKEFYKQNAEKIKERTRKYRLVNPDKKKEMDRSHYENNKDKIIQNSKEWRENNKERTNEIHREWQKRNQPAKNANTAKYRADKLSQTPKWLTQQQLDEIKRIYLNCPKGFHVDHIVPINGTNVRGLHTPWNLQYLPALDNMKKSNKS